jgi:hypothetical protein
MLGRRDLGTAKEFISDIASRLKNRVQITADEHRPYLQAIEDEFGDDVDFAQLQKIYGAPRENETCYSPAVCIGCEMKTVAGNPDPKHVSRSYVERQNLVGPHLHAALHAVVERIQPQSRESCGCDCPQLFRLQLIKIHRTLRMSPAMAAGVTDRLWDVNDVVALWEAYEQRRAERAA